MPPSSTASGSPRRSPSARPAVYQHADLADLDAKLTAARDRRVQLVITDGVFSMEGSIAQAPRSARALPQAPGGAGGRRLARHRRAGRDRARHGGALRRAWARWTSSPPRWARRSAARPAGSSAASAAVCDYLTQRARPQLFSNALPPTVAASCARRIEYLEAHPERVTRLRENARYFREQLLGAGLQAAPRRDADHPGHPGRDRGRHPDERPAAGGRASSSPASVTRWCRRARPACVARSPPRTPGTISTRRSPPSPRSGDSSASFSSPDSLPRKISPRHRVFWLAPLAFRW